MKRTVVFIFALLLLPSVVFGACATSCTKEATTYTCTDITVDCIQEAVTAATAADTILFSGDGSETWSSTVTVGKALTINLNTTTLTAGAALTNGFFRITGFTDNDNVMRITGGTLDSVNNTGTRRGIYIDTVTLGKLRIDNMTFHYGSVQIDVGGSFGVIDNNHFYNGMSALYLSAGTRAQADASWTTMTAGSANALFIEDNHIIIDANWPGGEATGNNGIEAYQGGKFVFRYNEFDYDASPYAGNLESIGFHGSASGACANGYWQQEGNEDCRRSPSLVEIYNNTYHGPRIDFMFALRGGSALIYNNTHTNDFGFARIRLREEEYYESSNWSPLRTAWPAEDQVHNTFIWGNTTQGNTMTSSSTYLAVDDYNAQCTGSAAPYACCTGSGTGTCNVGQADAFIKEDREFFYHAPQATGGKASFTSANGAAGSHPTDGDPYATAGTMTFSAEGANAYYPYTAYTYRHPLQNAADTTPPTLSGLTPSGTIPYQTTTQLSVTTNESSMCRYHASSTTWASMTEMSSTGNLTHTQTVSVSVGENTFKAVCQDTAAQNESNAGTWSFTVSAAPTPGTISRGTGSTITLGTGGTITR